MIEMVLTMALQLIGWAIQMIGMFINPICQLVFGMDYSELLQASLIDVIQMVTLKDLLIVMAYFRLLFGGCRRIGLAISSLIGRKRKNQPSILKLFPSSTFACPKELGMKAIETVSKTIL